jgi:diadenosine tetraphosphate (Ap4A) HIT family hydrolase
MCAVTACEVCAHNRAVEVGDHRGGIARLQTGYVKLPPTQYFRGYVTFSAKTCAPELHVLSPAERRLFLEEMASVAHAMWRALAPRKLNYELLGNGVAHLHWHLFPRYDTDAHPGGPVWEDLNFLRNLWTGGAVLPTAEVDELRRLILAELTHEEVEIERAFI